MKNTSLWKPTKFVVIGGELRGSSDLEEVGAGSRLVADLLAQTYSVALARYARGRLLDVGCGKVPLYGAYAGLVTESICIDRGGTPDRERHLDHVCDLTKGIPAEVGKVDTVLATDVLEHLPDPVRSFRDFADVLVPGGTLILGVPFLYWLHEEPNDYVRLTEYGLSHLCRENSLEVLELEPYGGAPEVILDIVGKHLGEVSLAGGAFHRLSRGVVGSSMVQRLSKVSKRKFPLGYCLVARREGGPIDLPSS